MSEDKEIQSRALPRHNDFLKARAVRKTAETFVRSTVWVYKVLRGEVVNKYTDGVKEFYEQEYKTISDKLNS